MSTMERLESTLCEIRQKGDIEAVALVSRDGMTIASQVPKGTQAETVLEEVDKESVSRVIVEVMDSRLITMGVGDQALLVVLTGPNVNLGEALVEIRKAVMRIEEIL